MSGSIFDRLRRQIGPRMSDEHDFGDQSHTPDQDATERDLGADAMSELARLISVSDPLTPVPGRTDEGHKPEGHKPEGRLADISRGAPSLTRDPVIRTPAREPASLQGRRLEDRRYGNDDGQSYEDRSSEDRFRHQPLERSARRDPDFAPPRMPVQPARADADNPGGLRAADDFFLRLPAGDDYAVAPRHALAGEEGYDHGDHSQRHPAYGRQHAEYADEYHEEEYGHDDSHEYPTNHDDADDGAPGHKRRRGSKVVIVVLGLTVFGSAAAVGYRAIFKAAPSGPAPFIRADNSPTKVVPAAVADSNAKPANGLTGDGSREQLVRRDEEPVDVARSYRTATGDAGTPGSSPPVSTAYPAGGGAAPASDPRRVRTVPIRVDQGAASSDRAASRPVPAPQSQASPPPQPQAPVPPRQAAASPAPNYTPSPAPSRLANAAPAALAPEAAPSRAIEAGGGFVVQVSAQRSEAEAQAAFRALQTKYPILNGRDLFIRRKDLGERGIFFAAQVGPFGVKGDADQLCETLKAAGGACFVQKN